MPFYLKGSNQKVKDESAQPCCFKVFTRPPLPDRRGLHDDGEFGGLHLLLLRSCQDWSGTSFPQLQSEGEILVPLYQDCKPCRYSVWCRVHIGHFRHSPRSSKDPRGGFQLQANCVWRRFLSFKGYEVQPHQPPASQVIAHDRAPLKLESIHQDYWSHALHLHVWHDWPPESSCNSPCAILYCHLFVSES